MAKATRPQTNFTAGEVSPRIRARHDLSKFHNALELQQNAITQVHGGSSRRGGFHFVAKTRFQNKAARLIEFKVKEDEQYSIEAGDRYFRFYRNRGQIQTTYAITAIDRVAHKVSIAGDQTSFMAAGDVFTITGSTGNDGTYTIDSVSFTVTTDIITIETLPDATADGNVKIPLTIPTIYDEADLKKIRYRQSADVAFLFHPDLQPRELRRLAGDDTLPATWQFTEFDFTDGPFLDLNITATTLDPSGVAGSITVVASDPLFAATDAPDSDNPHGRLIRINYAAAWGLMEITAFGTTTSVTATVIGTLPADTPTVNWRLGAWSRTTGWPEVVRIHQQRIITGKAQRVSVSNLGFFTDFKPSNLADGQVLDEHAFDYLLDDDRLNTIREIVGETEGLLFLTNDGIFLGGAQGGPKDPITPDTFEAHRQNTQGHHPDVRAHQVGNLTLYMSKSGRKLRELLFRIEIDKFKAPDISRLAEHITVGGVVDTAYQEEPDSILWVVRADGVLLGVTYEPDEQVLGWSRQIMGGKLLGANQAEAESIAVARDSGDDLLWAMVKRTINAVTVRSVEYKEPQFDVDDDIEDAFLIDAGATLDNRKTITAISNTNPVVVTAAGHGLVNGDTVKIRKVFGFTDPAKPRVDNLGRTISALDFRSFTAIAVAGATFQLKDEDATTYTVYEGGGTAAKEVTSVSNLDYLNGEKVTVLADAAVFTELLVAAGKITIPEKASVVHAGLPYRHVQFSMPMLPEVQGVDPKVLLKKIFHAHVEFHNSLGGAIGRTVDEAKAITFRKVSTPVEQPTPPFSGIQRFRIGAPHEQLPQIAFVSDDPLPFTLLGMTLEFDVGGS